MAPNVYAPDDLLDRYRALLGTVSVEHFFRASGMSRLREMWCAAHFSRAYSSRFGPCRVRIEEEDEQHDFDFELGVDGSWHLFQVTEVMEPGRHRAAEYKNFVPGTTRDDDWGPGTEHGSEWIRLAILAKVAKIYAREAQLNLLLYVNFPAYEQNFELIRNHCASNFGQFRSIWLLNGNALCCIKSSPDLGSVEGWLPIPESLVHDEP